MPSLWTGSLKARQLREDNRAEAVLRWGNLQCRVRGVVHRGTQAQCKLCFRNQPPGAQLSLPLLDQGQPIDEAGFANIAAAVEAEKHARSVPHCPKNYVALRLEPSTLEFYSGGHRDFLNDRWLYIRQEPAAWKRIRLQP